MYFYLSCSSGSPTQPLRLYWQFSPINKIFYSDLFIKSIILLLFNFCWKYKCIQTVRNIMPTYLVVKMCAYDLMLVFRILKRIFSRSRSVSLILNEKKKSILLSLYAQKLHTCKMSRKVYFNFLTSIYKILKDSEKYFYVQSDVWNCRNHLVLKLTKCNTPEICII